ncbi:MAG: hypothetical protein Q8873_08980 [Bacillota bacterium]|nr:hypothetical protein [Bacillota bacterium]
MNIERDVPMGFGMALAQNIDAMEYFSKLSHAQQQAIIDGTHSIQSKSDMQSYVSNMMQKD